ncbi:toxin-antitoxin system YwqK family antitoxin [Botrimarina hoheduenensis]|uniref:MORN repeat variant n=1 Tax=Botrimarina hoheduenensis TaxID=2528000 RepID=A0A5C5VTU6_9BACT|nr:hypothetical protein [Botrimarina hoheduenensis]TWT41553.1 MORN repeat variant [Botrimarina hoheduenensis]
MLFRLLLAATLAIPLGAASPVGAYSPREGGHRIARDDNSVVNERDERGVIRISREVRLNERGDFENHGNWRAWDAEGQLIGQGRYAAGERTGGWCRWAGQDELSPTMAARLVGFEAPFLSQATFRDGRLQGAWSVFDAAGRTAIEISFRDGQRHGEAHFFDSAGLLKERSRYAAGLLSGPVEALDADGALTEVAQYVEGREVGVREEPTDDGAGRVRQELLGPVLREATPDDFWLLEVASYAARGKELRHGLRQVWSRSGQLRLTTHYEWGVATGPAQWWHENGQLAAAGAYFQGVADGSWRWWHRNGALAARGQYAEGRLATPLAAWDAAGHRSEAAQSLATLADRRESPR